MQREELVVDLDRVVDRVFVIGRSLNRLSNLGSCAVEGLEAGQSAKGTSRVGIDQLKAINV